MPDDKPQTINSTETGAVLEKETASANQIDFRTVRRPAWVSSWAALQYISALARKNFRKSDKVTDIVVSVCLLVVALFIFAPTTLLKPQIILSLDFVFLAATIFFLMKRLGILITLSERQAVLVWDIVVGSLLFGMLLSFNTMLFIAYLSRSSF